MFFNTAVSKEHVMRWVDTQLAGVLPIAKNGVDVDIKPHKNPRSNAQNRFLMAILVALVRFYHETGFMPQGLSAWAMRTDILKEYYKARFGVISTAKLSAKAFGEFVDSVQQSLVEETGGEWEVLEPDSAYLQSLVEQGGM